MKQSVVRNIVLVAAVLGLSLAVYQILVSTRPKAKVRQEEARKTIVKVVELQPENRRVRVIAMGTVIPARELKLSPEVSGRIVKLNDKLIPGGFLKEGEIILKLDRRDYAAAVRKANARLAEAKSNLELEEGRQVVAREEWDYMNRGDPSDEPAELALRKPQLAAARASISSARSDLEQAHLNLSRTVIKAPFDVIVLSESAEVGQLVSPQMALATLVGADKFRVQVSVPVSNIPWIEMPDVEGKGGPGRADAEAEIVYEADNKMTVKRKGRVVRLLGDLDPAGRMARVLVEIEDPMGIYSEEKSDSEFPLLIGAYVRVEIIGKEIENVFAIPRVAVREGDMLWLMGPDDKLEIRKIDILWRAEKEVLVGEGLAAGERVVTSNIPTPIPGIPLSLEEETATPESDIESRY